MRPERAGHGLQQLQLRPRPQPPGHDHQGREDGGLLPEDAVLSAELGAAPRVASLDLPAASSHHEILTVAQQAKADAACAEANAARPVEGFCHAAPRLSLLRLLPPPRPPISFCAGTAPKPVGGAAGRDETPAANSVPTSRATAALTKRRARPSHVHTKSTGATVGAKAAGGKEARAGGRGRG
jgi:hypothetical protein